MQMSLSFLENPPLRSEIWEYLDEVQRAVVLEQLAQLIAKTARAERGQEESKHE
jgi:hypothetical protein